MGVADVEHRVHYARAIRTGDYRRMELSPKDFLVKLDRFAAVAVEPEMSRQRVHPFRDRLGGRLWHQLNSVR